MESDRGALIALSCVGGVGPVAVREAIAHPEGPSGALARLAPARRREAHQRASQLLEDCERAGVSVFVQGDKEYPTRLLDLADAPPILFALGRADTLSGPMVSIVGTRSASAYGERVARRLSAALGERGVTVVSGMARGIDAAAHVGALEASGRTVAVVAGGVDAANPPRHRGLHAEIVERGLVVGESPCGTAPRPGAFPRRNRLIAALGAATIVIEAGARSGALLTSRLAIEMGRPVGAVPGPIDSPTSVGTNALVRDGATPITSVADILLLAGISAPATAREVEVNVMGSSDAIAGGGLAERLWQRLRQGPAGLDSLVAESEASPREVLRALTSLEVAGLIQNEASQYAAL